MFPCAKLLGAGRTLGMVGRRSQSTGSDERTRRDEGINKGRFDDSHNSCDLRVNDFRWAPPGACIPSENGPNKKSRPNDNQKYSVSTVDTELLTTMTTFEQYSSEEADAISNGEKLVCPEMLLDRWGISKKELRKIINGQHRSGVHLPALRFGAKTKRFRLTDVVRAEFELYER
jgi:hypothetical protein